MRNLLLVSFVSLVSLSYGQLWFDVGIKGGPGAGFPINKTLNNDGRFGATAGFNYFFGGKVGINYGHYVGFTCDVDYGGYKFGFTQAEVPGKVQTENYRYKISYNALNVMPMFRFTKEASYLEIGPQFSFIKNPLIEDEAYPLSAPSGNEYINNNLTGITFGFGGHMIGNEIISLMAGLRFNYVISNLTSDTWSSSNFPFSNYPSITETAKTNPINVQVVFELNYSLGYIAKSSSGCGKRAAFLKF